jgi:hypothetical protein
MLAAALGIIGILGLSGSASAESPRNMMLEIKFGPYSPDLDKEFQGATPYKDIFGSGARLMTRLQLDYEFFTDVGILAVGGSLGFFQAKGSGLKAGASLPDGSTELEKSGDSTKFNILPLSLDLIYRFDYLWQRFHVPLVPWVKGGLDYYVWWITNGVGKIAKSEDGSSGRGGTFGGHVSFGLGFVLDSLAPGMAQTFDVEIGVNTTILFAEYQLNWIDDFGSSKSFNLSDWNFLAGIAFEF